MTTLFFFNWVLGLVQLRSLRIHTIGRGLPFRCPGGDVLFLHLLDCLLWKLRCRMNYRLDQVQGSVPIVSPRFLLSRGWFDWSNRNAEHRRAQHTWILTKDPSTFLSSRVSTAWPSTDRPTRMKRTLLWCLLMHHMPRNSTDIKSKPAITMRSKEALFDQIFKLDAAPERTQTSPLTSKAPPRQRHSSNLLLILHH